MRVKTDDLYRGFTRECVKALRKKTSVHTPHTHGVSSTYIARTARRIVIHNRAPEKNPYFLLKFTKNRESHRVIHSQKMSFLNLKNLPKTAKVPFPNLQSTFARRKTALTPEKAQKRTTPKRRWLNFNAKLNFQD